MTEWWKIIPEKKQRKPRFYRRQKGWNELRILREPVIVKNNFGQEVLRLATDKGYIDVSFSSQLAIALKKAGEKQNYEIAGCKLEFDYDKESRTYKEIIVSKGGRALYRRSFDEVGKAENTVEECTNALKEVLEKDTVHTLESIKHLLTVRGHSFTDDTVFHVVQRLKETGALREVEERTFWVVKPEL